MQWLRAHLMLVAFLVVFAVAQTVLLVEGNGAYSLLEASILAILCLLTRWFTRKGAGTPARTPHGRMIGLQMLIVIVVILAITLEGSFSYHLTPAWARMPLWSTLHDSILTRASPHMAFAYANGVANLVMYCLPIAVGLLLLGVPLAQQGLGRFRKGSLASAMAWLLPMLGIFVVLVATGRISLRYVPRTWLSNLLQNGVSEEFLWRGAILGRLRAVMSSEHALYLQALLFGLCHAGVLFSMFKGNLPGLFAEVIVDQTTFGLAMGYITLRTGNIAIGSVFHLLLDSAQPFLG